MHVIGLRCMSDICLHRFRVDNSAMNYDYLVLLMTSYACANYMLPGHRLVSLDLQSN